MDVKSQSFTDPRLAAAVAPRRREGGGFVWFLIKLLVVVLALRVFVFSPFSIPSESMLPRLMKGDYLVAAKWPYGFSRHSLPFDLPLPAGRVLASPPERGDVVIFKHPVDGSDYIKRVIGLPGDSVAVIGGQVVLNGQLVERKPLHDFLAPMSPNTGCTWGGRVVQLKDRSEACAYRRFRESLPGGRRYEVLDFGLTPGDSFAPVTVPEGMMFVMGDNRDNSRDSRWPAAAGDAVGLVPLERLVGRAGIIVWSTDGSAEWAKPWTWFSATRWARIGASL
ncbi:signal peptidase I [Erythrobacter tepidarius]|uniref:signal peptidase I n=1 Tax=Erythrobacter tepidarius TaxID=60454 RepID=UPI000A362982|nr:signal peptidase I [Erythrobacter tepidarius]